MLTAAQIKFKLSVAGGLHSGAGRSQTGTFRRSDGDSAAIKRCFTVDHPGCRGFNDPQQSGGCGMAGDADVIVVGGRTRGPRRRNRDRRRRQDASSWSIRKANRASAARPSGRSADCFWSIHPNSAGSASRTVTIWRCRTGWDRRASTATRMLWPRRWAEAYVAFAAGEKRGWLRAMGHRIFPAGRLGRARRLRCDGPRQFGAAVSRHLGHRPRRGRAVRAAGARSGGQRAADVQIPPPRRCAVDHQRHRRRRQRFDPRA